MATTAGHRLTLDPMGKCSNAFFSETTNMIKAKLYMNVHWMVLYNLKVFCSDMKFKMAATAGLSLTLDPMGKMFLHTERISEYKLNYHPFQILDSDHISSYTSAGSILQLCKVSQKSNKPFRRSCVYKVHDPPFRESIS